MSTTLTVDTVRGHWRYLEVGRGLEATSLRLLRDCNSTSHVRCVRSSHGPFRRAVPDSRRRCPWNRERRLIGRDGGRDWIELRRQGCGQ
jgi:hypothetical protein